MKKGVLIYLSILVASAILISIFIFNNGKNGIKDENEISKIVEDSNLEILLNLENIALNMYSEKNILKTAMMYAEKNGYMSENTDNGYTQYVSQTELHDIINELTNIKIEAPIQIEDFYFIYNSENDYYYCIPIEYPSFKISKVNNILKNGNEFTIECVATKKEDNDTTVEKTFITKLKKIDNGTYTKYQVIKQEVK